METQTLRFIEHNKDVPIIKAEWLDKNKKPVRGSPETWVFNKITLKDGTTYILPSDDVDKVITWNWYTRSNQGKPHDER